jgi:hypothetical protein
MSMSKCAWINSISASLTIFLGAGSALATPSTSQVYHLVSSLNSTKCADSSSSSVDYLINDCSSTSATQDLMLVSVSGGYEIVNQSTKLCMGVVGATTSYGAAIDQETCSTSKSNQTWVLNAYESSYELQNANGHACLDLNNGSVTDGNKLQQYGCYALGSNPNQIWNLAAIAATPIPAPTALATPTPLAAGVSIYPVGALTSLAGQTILLPFNLAANAATSTTATVSLELQNSSGTSVFSSTIAPPVPSTTWSGNVSFSSYVTIPTSIPNGTYKIAVQLFDSSGTMSLHAASGVTTLSSGYYEAGTLNIISDPGTVTVTVDPTTKLHSLTSTFQGLSYEMSWVPREILAATDTDLVALLKNLGPGILRIGGDSADQVLWQANGPGLNISYVAPSDIDRVAGLLKATGWKAIWTLNLGIGSPSDAAAEAAYVVKSFGSSLQTLVIGNEPDLYYRNGLRSSSYTYQNYISDFLYFSKFILAETPSAPISGPDSAEFFQTFTIPVMQSESSNIQMATEHYYVNSGTPSTSLTTLLQPDSLMLQTLQSLDYYSRLYKVTGGYRLDETNAFYEVSPFVNDFGVGLWALDYMFIAANQGAAGINLSAVGGAPINDDHNSQILNVNAEYYAMKLFSLIANGNTVPATASPMKTTVTSYATVASNGAVNVVVINKGSASQQTQITVPEIYSQATQLPMTGPSVTSTSALLGEHTLAINGAWSGGPSAFTGLSHNGTSTSLTMVVPAYSAILITLTQ